MTKTLDDAKTGLGHIYDDLRAGRITPKQARAESKKADGIITQAAADLRELKRRQ